MSAPVLPFSRPEVVPPSGALQIKPATVTQLAFLAKLEALRTLDPELVAGLETIVAGQWQRLAKVGQ